MSSVGYWRGSCRVAVPDPLFRMGHADQTAGTGPRAWGPGRERRSRIGDLVRPCSDQIRAFVLRRTGFGCHFAALTC